jgi:hypothetical protein
MAATGLADDVAITNSTPAGVAKGISRTRGNEWTTAAEDADKRFVGVPHHVATTAITTRLAT